MVPRMKFSICNVILMRMLSPFVKIHLSDSNDYTSLSLLVRERAVLRSMQGLPPPFSGNCNFLRRCLRGGDAYLCNAWHCWFHWNICLLSGVLNTGVKLFNFVGKNIVTFLLLTCSLYVGFIYLPLLLCILLITFGHRRPHLWPHRFWSRCDLSFWSICHLPMNNLGVGIC